MRGLLVRLGSMAGQATAGLAGRTHLYVAYFIKNGA